MTFRADKSYGNEYRNKVCFLSRLNILGTGRTVVSERVRMFQRFLCCWLDLSSLCNFIAYMTMEGTGNCQTLISTVHSGIPFTDTKCLNGFLDRCLAFISKKRSFYIEVNSTMVFFRDSSEVLSNPPIFSTS